MLDPSFVSRNLRVAISEWYSWLSDKSIKQDEWRSVPHWCKRVPSRLDIPWALNDLDKSIGRRQLMRALFVVIDEIHMASSQMDGVPSVEKLRNHLLSWYEKEYE
mgnify:FL=1